MIARNALDRAMRKFVIVAIVGVLPACAAAAELPKRTTTAPPREVKTNPCAAYGAGFVKVEGTRTCVKIGGTVSVEGGRSH